MRSTRVLVGCLSVTTTVTVAALTLVGSAGVAVADGETCQGQPATVVGSAGSEITGTDGPDVVVTNGAATAYTGAGDDLVCVTGSSPSEYVDVVVEGGDDVIDASTSGAKRVFAALGAGDDTYTGGPRPDLVWASNPWETPRNEGADTVATGGGADLVVSGGTMAEPDHDSVDLGPGRDEAWLEGPVDASLPILGGAGSDLLELDRSTLRHALVIDNALGQATDAGVKVMAWDGMERFRLTPMGVWQAPSFVGGAGPERLWTAIPLTSLDLGDGDDRVDLELQRGRLVDHASYAGGAGDDTFILYAGPGDQARRVRLDLPAARLLFRRDELAVRARISGFELHRLSARRLDVRGTAATDHVQWSGCRGMVAGGPGDDLIEAISVEDAGCGYLGDDAQLVVRGGPGDDRLLGKSFPDTLLGGPGNDVADGRSNRDRCVAETRVHCER